MHMRCFMLARRALRIQRRRIISANKERWKVEGKRGQRCASARDFRSGMPEDASCPALSSYR